VDYLKPLIKARIERLENGIDACQCEVDRLIAAVAERNAEMRQQLDEMHAMQDEIEALRAA
jgi:uncharacterized coiled-coil protein SlyX